ncbi:hypothetical protein GOP47_0017920 [Adiantum capillus-veneris]|uniref:MHD2 domain-containing protein n=1 Tax=Adiantum capillus-veneris TaxID=13818 RepID=A0A9D4UGS7_ADICA|nr:hypothetical protein GOP47_0017920 [Adiantum capillus-veneris]
MAPHLNRLTTVSQQPSLRDYKPHRHTFSLSSILDSHTWKESISIPQTPSSQAGNDDLEGSFRILFYDTLSHKVKELVFSAEEDFDSNILDILQPQSISGQASCLSSQNSTDSEANTSDLDSHLCEAALRSVYAQGNLELSIKDRQELADNVKRAFLLPEATFRESRSRAVKAVRHRRAEVQAHLTDLQQDKGWSLNPEHFESVSFYEECKSRELFELSSFHEELQSLPSFSAQVQVSVMSAEDLSSNNQCLKKRMCYGASEGSQVYCTVRVVPAGQGLNDVESSTPNFITELSVFSKFAEWHDKSPWISLCSADDCLCITLWKKKAPTTSISRASKELELGPLLRTISQRTKKITWHGDTFLGCVFLPVSKIESQSLSSASLRGSLSPNLYNLNNAEGEKLMVTLKMQIHFYCELLLNDSVHDKMLLYPPIPDVVDGYHALVLLAFSMHLEGELELEDTWQKILACYESYYRLRRETCSLAVLKHLATLFQPELEYLEIITRELKPICKNAKQGKLNKLEYSLLAEVTALIIKPSITVMEDFQSVFLLDQPQRAISKLIELLSLLLCWDPNPLELKACFNRWIKISCAQRFNKYLEDNSCQGEINTRTFSTAFSLLQKDLRTLRACLQTEYSNKLGFFETCALEYYRLVSQYITGIVGSIRISPADFEDLTRELSLLHQELERSDVKIDFLDLHGLLHDHILEMIAAVKPRMIDWIISNLGEEKWEPISHETDALFSYSVVDLYFMINGVIENLTARLSYFPFGKVYYANLEESLCSAVETYIQITERMCLQELPEKNVEEHHHFLDHFKSLNSSKFMNISKTLCVKLNNLYSVLQQQMSLEENLAIKWGVPLQPSSTDLKMQEVFKLEDREATKLDNQDLVEDKRVGRHFKHLHDLVKRSISDITGSITEHMQHELSGRLQKLMTAFSITGKKQLAIEDLELLTTYFDTHLKALNEWLEPEVFRRLLLEIAGALIFCMEEFALNRDEDPNPMTMEQRDYMEQILNLFYGYFYGDGVGVSKEDMDGISRRLRKILECSDLNTHKLCALYWKAWDSKDKMMRHKLLSATRNFLQKIRRCRPPFGKRENAISPPECIIFDLPKDEEMVASFTCRKSKGRLGILFITAKHVSFADASIPGSDNKSLFILSLDRLQQVNLVGHDSLSFMSFTNNVEKFSRFLDRRAVLQVIYNQVKSTGSFLEMYLARVWGQLVGESVEADTTALKRFKCSRQGLISKHRGLLTVYTSYLIFEQERKVKKLFLEFGAISKVFAEMRGLRANGIVMELKSRSSIEFVDFEVALNPRDIAVEIAKLVTGGAREKN